MKNRRNAFLLTLLMASSYATAQTVPPEQPPQFRAEVRAVLVDVLVLDSESRPVAGLTREEFQVYEDGVLQQIDNFDVIDWSSYVAREVPLEEPTAIPPGSVNAFPRRFIFVINRQGAEFGFMVRAKRALESFIVESMADGDEAMVVDIGMSTRITQQFQASKEDSIRSVRKLTPMQANLYYGTELATRNVYDTLRGLGEGLRAFPGRKILLFMSPELNQNEFLLHELQRTINALNQSNTTVYSIDIEGARGVPSPTSTGFAGVWEIGGLFPLAHETGGRYYYNMNTFEPAVRRIGEENSRYYLLSYISTNTELDGTYRQIEVRVGRPELTVVARRGYFARRADEPVVAEGEKGSDKKPTPESETPSAPAPPADSGEPPSGPRPPAQVEITSYLLPAGPGKVDVPIAVALPSDLLTTEDAQPVSRTLRLTLGDGAGKTIEAFTQTVDPKNFFVIRKAALQPGSYLLQITLDEVDKTIYQASTQIDVPRELGERFGLSSIIPIVGPSPGSRPDDAVQIQPTSTLRRGEDLFLYFRVYPGTNPPSQTARVSYTFYRGDEKLNSADHPETLDLSESTETGVPVITRLPVGQQAAGDYRVVVTAHDSRLGRKATGELRFVMR